MGKILILTLVIFGAFWIGRLSAGAKKDKVSKDTSQNDSSIIDIEIEE